MTASRPDPTLARLIRRSPALDASTRRQWLAVLPHLSPDDRERLREILTNLSASPPAPHRQGLTMTVLAEALVRWQHAAGPYWPYVCAAPFLAAQEWRGEPRARAKRWTARERAVVDWLVGDSPGQASLILVDLPPEPVLALAPLLVERGWYVVPVIQRWIASPAVLPCRSLLETLLRGTRQARRPSHPRGAILIADGERSGPPGYPTVVSGRAFDNRYEYQICRFPSLDFLRDQGVRQVRWITGRADGMVGGDLAPYLEDVLRAGIEVEIARVELGPWSPPR